MSNHARIVMLLLITSLVLPVQAAKEQFIEWKLNIVFVNASKQYSDKEIKDKIAGWVAEAERLYQRRPALKIDYTVVRQTEKGGKDLSSIVFESDAAYRKFMNDNFDVQAVTRTEGHLPVLLTDKLCMGTDRKTGEPDCAGGIASFPHWTQLTSSKRGITIVAYKDEHTLAHELGHVFSLRHTFDSYIGFNPNCNKDYRPTGKPEGKCNSCGQGRIVYDENNDPKWCEGPVNIMDYCTNLKHDSEFLNPCQEDRAAQQRYAYMTDEGKTNYFRLKGIAGEAVCEEDADCEDGRYCDKGVVAGVGRNQCKEVKALGQGCTRADECASGRCAGLKCAAADECNVDPDCGAGRYCAKGPIGLGRNTCESRLADNRPCTSNGQCSSGSCSQWRPQDGQTSGICFTPASKAAGESCTIDPQCRTGKCNSKKQCVCKEDADCGAGNWCDKGIDLKENVCRNKLDKGEVCGTVGELGTGHRCKSGSCKLSGVTKNLTCQ